MSQEKQMSGKNSRPPMAITTYGLDYVFHGCQGEKCVTPEGEHGFKITYIGPAIGSIPPGFVIIRADLRKFARALWCAAIGIPEPSEEVSTND